MRFVLLAVGIVILLMIFTGQAQGDNPKPLVDPAFDSQCLQTHEVCALEVGPQLIPNDALYPQQYGPQRIAAPAAWDVTVGDAATVIAIVDTGVYCGHPDLIGKCLSTGYDWVNNDNDPVDDHGHGTHVASTAAAATNNALGIAGICWNCLILPEKVLDSGGGGSWQQVANGITHAADNGADIISMSLGGAGGDSVVENAVNYAYSKGVLVVSACGNSGSNDNCLFPARYLNSIAVSCSDSNDKACSFTSYGSEVDVSAPGLSILAAVPASGAPCCSDPSGYKTLSGTSMSTPHVSGTAGLVRSLHPELSVDQVWGLLEQSADDSGATGFDIIYGFGRINAFGAVTQTAPAERLTKPPLPTPAPPPPSIIVEITQPLDGATMKAHSYVCAQITPTSAVQFLTASRWFLFSPTNNRSQSIDINAPKAFQCKTFNVRKEFNLPDPAAMLKFCAWGDRIELTCDAVTVNFVP